MKTTNLKCMAMAIFALIGFSNCTNSPTKNAENVETAQKNLDNAEKDLQKSVIDSTNEYTRFRIESESKLKENDVKITALKSKLKTDKLNIRTKYEKELNDLEVKNATLKTDIANYKESDKNKWEIFKTKFNKDLDEIAKAISNVATN